jgi:hypothetical protein
MLLVNPKPDALFRIPMMLTSSRLLLLMVILILRLRPSLLFHSPEASDAKP